MPDVVIRIPLFTRINIILGVLVSSFAPLLWTWQAVRAGEMDEQSWIVLVLELVMTPQQVTWNTRPSFNTARGAIAG
jgi:hypothetical protein